MEQSDTVLVLISFTGGFYFGESLAGIQHEVARAGGRLVVHQTSAQVLPYVEADLPQATTPVAWGHAVGAISVAGAAGRSSLERLTESGVPVVLASQSIPGFPAPVAMPDNLGGTSAALAHLLGHGHTRIGFVGNIAGTDMRERYAAYHQTLVDHGLAPEPTHFLPCAENGEIGGTQAAERFLALPERPTAVMCATDRNAIGFLSRVRRAGLSVPEDVAVIGFDNIEAGAYAVPALATVDQKFHAVGALAGRLLVRLVEDGPDAFPGGTVEHAPSAYVVPRSSCGCTGDAVRPPMRIAPPERPGASTRPIAVTPPTQDLAPEARLRADLTAALETDRSSGATEHVEATALAVENLVLDALRTGLVPPADHVAGAVEAASRALLRAEGLDELISAIDTYLRRVAATGLRDDGDSRDGASGALPDLERLRLTIGALRARLTATRSHLHAARYLQRSLSAEESLFEGYLVGRSLLGADAAPPEQLAWLAGTHVRVGALALWREGELEITGAHDPGLVLPDLAGRRMPPEQFPPSEILDQVRSHAGEVAYVIPVRSPGREWGLLALVAGIDVDSNRETYTHWSSLLASAFDQHDLIRAVRQSEERHGLLASALNEGLWELDTATKEVTFSARGLALLGLEHLPHAHRLGVWRRCVHEGDLEHLERTIRDVAAGTLPVAEIEYRYRGPLDPEHRWMMVRVMPSARRSDGRAARLIGTMGDITRRKQLEEELRRHALYDPATGLPNRRMFLDRLRQSVSRAHLDGAPFAVVFLDLDRFKVVNDSLGHQTGDRLLRAVSERLAAVLRPTDMAARFGGDEFAVLLDGIEPLAVHAVARRLIESLSRPFEVDGHSLWVTASLGVASSAVPYTDAEDVLRDADTAMYHAKTHEPGSAAFFDSAMHQDALQHLSLQAEVQLALDRDEFEVYYQPIVELDDSPVARFEALVRWNHPTRGLVLPGTFLPLMEETGLIVRLGQRVVESTCRDVAQWRTAYEGPVTVSVNLSDREFWHTGLAQHVLDCLARHELPAECLTLEITEGVIARRPELADQLLRQFHAAGLQLHIDDFGTGHSSLQTLHRYPVDALKIDRSFVHGLAEEQQSRELVRAIVAMGRALGLTVIAEGVETREQLAILRDVGCESAQGFLFDRALPADRAAALLGTPPVEAAV
ncbi:EAL domain-containing protein [Cellulomonas soli]|uniref:Diguanylate cyclase n=1 Tax=Cellulomonas soli TaxID=931535 RepID=A0A512PGI4_9CELL|nr:EAL domain-containing protein [Cellulomonas soli]NYI58160.1 diguanylate cyclase (GGDEF)-like protein/PAS domain S-box-containing protein [Cellulomonas soli]GEP70293.1 hypothetical protein CSO01_30080 [Cellulomonas soli]